MTSEQKNKLLQLGKQSNHNDPNQRVNVYIPIYANDELIWDAEKRKHENQHLRLNHINVEGKNVLDLGCNTGYISFQLADKAKSIVGIDKDPKVLEICNLIKEIDQIDNVEFLEFNKWNLEKDNNLLENHKNYPFDVALNLSNFHIEETVRELKLWGHIAKVWYIEPTNHQTHFTEQEETIRQAKEEFSQFGEVEFLTYTDYQDRGLFKLTMNE
jgi:SAM-dependent methyltransferase